MAKRKVGFTFPEELIREPIIYTLNQQFGVVTNIFQADISESGGWVKLDIEGDDKQLDDAIIWVTSKGVRVDTY